MDQSRLVVCLANSLSAGGVQVGASQGGGPASMPSIVAGSPTPRGARLGAASVKEPASRDTSVDRERRYPVERPAGGCFWIRPSDAVAVTTAAPSLTDHVPG